MAFPPLPRLLQFSLLLILIFGILMPANCKMDPEFWDATLPSTKLPKFLRLRMSSLSSKSVHKVLSYIKKGTLSSHSKDFCKVARLACDPHSHVSNASIPLYLENGGSSRLRNVYFKKSDIQVGQLITAPDLHSDIPSRSFLPRALAKKLPFSNKTLPSLVEMLNIPSNSPLAKYMQETLSSCEKQQKKQTKKCVTSLEEMVRFVQRKLGSHLDILQTSWRPALSHKNVTVRDMALKGSPKNHKTIVCSDAMFPYSVFSCHVVKNVRNMEVTLETEGSKHTMKGVMQCSTIKWHVIEEVTFVPLLRGEEEELCHWMSDHDLVFVGKDKDKEKKKKKNAEKKGDEKKQQQNDEKEKGRGEEIAHMSSM